MKVHYRIVVFQLVLFFVIGLMVVSFIGCGGWPEEEESSSDNSPDVTTNKLKVFLPSGVKKNKKVKGDFDGAFIKSGYQALDSKETVSDESDQTATKSDIAGFVVEVPPLQEETAIDEVVYSFDRTLRSGVVQLSGQLTIVSQQYLEDAVTAVSVYSLSFTDPIAPSELGGYILEFIGLNQADGEMRKYPEPSNDEPLISEYSLYLTVVYYSEEIIYVSAALAPNALFDTYKPILTGITSPTNVGKKNENVAKKTQKFEVGESGGLADFLFVIDNSGSMSDEQEAVSQAATDFTNIMNDSGLDYHIATITTDSQELQDTNGDGGFTTNLEEFAQDVVVGTNGGSTESGTWFAEQALIDGGSVSQLGYPRTDSVLLVVIMSDEPDSYYRFSSDGEPLNQDNNVFYNHGYYVFSIVDTDVDSSAYGEDYIALSNATNGSYASISDLDSFPEIMSIIAETAGGFSSRFQLEYKPIISTLSVKIKGKTIKNSSENGWTYNISSNSVVFHGEIIPAAGATVTVQYKYIKTSAE